MYREMMAIAPRTMSRDFHRLLDLALREKPTIVHIRLGDYRNEPRFGVLSENYYANAFAELGISQEDNVWIFSNEPELVKASYLHILCGSVSIIEDQRLSPAELLELMRYGHKYVIGNSTLSWWAARLSFNPQAPVIAPKPWFKCLPEPFELVPTDWLRLESEWKSSRSD